MSSRAGAEEGGQDPESQKNNFPHSPTGLNASSHMSVENAVAVTRGMPRQREILLLTETSVTPPPNIAGHMSESALACSDVMRSGFVAHWFKVVVVAVVL